MAWRRSVVLVLLATLAAGCSTSQGGTAVIGSVPASSSSPASSASSTSAASSETSESSTTSSAASDSTVSSSPAATTASATASPTVPTVPTVPSATTVPTVITVPGTTTSSSRPTVTSSATASSATASSRTASATTPSSRQTVTTSTSARAAAFPLCPTVSPTDARAIVGCLRTSLSTFWSGELNEVVDQPVVVEPTAAQVPQQCRSAITTTAAFTCQVDNTVYLNTGLVESARKNFPPAEMPYVFAAVMGHEIGHVVQAAVKQPGYADTGQSDQISQRIEQQADCLDGVWAHSLIAQRQLDQATFVRVTNTFLTSISSNPEIAGHGTPPVRAAALAKGLKDGRPQDCGLATFS